MLKIETKFSVSEEDFLLRSLKEVVNVWAKGSGQATFSLNINNGVADLKLSFQLGLPSDAHLHHQHHGPVHQHLPSQGHKACQGRRKTLSGSGSLATFLTSCCSVVERWCASLGAQVRILAVSFRVSLEVPLTTSSKYTRHASAQHLSLQHLSSIVALLKIRVAKSKCSKRKLSSLSLEKATLATTQP